VRIERLWRDVTDKVGKRWYSIFCELADAWNYDPDYNPDVWLGCLLFLPQINSELEFFRRQHNSHRLATERNQTPEALFFLSQTTGGVRGLWRDDSQDGPLAWPTEQEVEDELYATAFDEDALEELTQAYASEVRGGVDLNDARCPFPQEEQLAAFLWQLDTMRHSDPVVRWQAAQELLQAHLRAALED
jgi:hypothetical protein